MRVAQWIGASGYEQKWEFESRRPLSYLHGKTRAIDSIGRCSLLFGLLELAVLCLKDWPRRNI